MPGPLRTASAALPEIWKLVRRAAISLPTCRRVRRLGSLDDPGLERGGAPLTHQAWRNTQRGRYQKIGSYLPRTDDDQRRTRLRIIRQRDYVISSFEGVMVNDKTYDHVILCTGNTREDVTRREDVTGREDVTRRAMLEPEAIGQGAALARKVPNFEVYRVGPAVGVSFSLAEAEEAYARDAATAVSVLRAVTRTAALGNQPNIPLPA